MAGEPVLIGTLDLDAGRGLVQMVVSKVAFREACAMMATVFGPVRNAQ